MSVYRAPGRRKFLQAGSAALAASTPFLGAYAQPGAAVLNMVYGENAPPNNWVVNGAVRGLIVDLVDDVAQRCGMVHRAQPYPLTRVQQMVQHGEADGMCLVATPDRLAYAVPSAEPLIVGRVSMFVRNDSPLLQRLKSVRSLDELAGVGATVLSMNGSSWAKQNLESRGIRVDYGGDTASPIKRLIGQRGDLVIDLSSQINWSLKEVAGSESVLELPVALQEVGWHLLISKRSPLAAQMPKFDKAIHALKADARYKAIFAKYGLKP